MSIPIGRTTTAFGGMACGTFHNPVTGSIQFEIRINIRRLCTGDSCWNQLDILLFCLLLVLFPKIGTVSNKGGGLFHVTIPCKTVLKKLAVGIGVLLKLIVGNYRTVFTYGFFDICCVSPIFFSGFFAEGCVWVGRILHHG